MAINKINKINLFSQYPVILSLIVSLIVLAIFSGVLIADFVMWDDDINMFMNTKIGGLSFKNIYLAFTDFDSMNRYGPLNSLNQMVMYHFFHLNPFGYHLVSWLFHGFSSGLLFLIIRKILLLSQLKIQNNNHKADWYINIAASFATLCWALHPLRVEPVAWIAASGHNQAVFFLLLSTLCYIKAVVLESDKKRYIFLIVSAFIFYTVSLFSQAIVITYFAIFFILDIFIFKRIGGSIGWKSQTAKRVLFEKLIFAIPAILVGVMSVVVRIKSAGISQPPISLSDFGLIERIMQAMYILSYYIWRQFYPVDLAPIYTTLFSFNPLSVPFILSALFVIFVSIVLFIFRRRLPIIFALWLSYIILLIPFMGFLEHPHFSADRYSLVPSICLSILIAFGLINLIKNNYISGIFISVLLVIFSLLGWLSFNQIKFWNNTKSLFSHTIETLGEDPNKQKIYWLLGKYLYENGEKEQAIINFEKALAINPYYTEVHSYLAEKEYKNNNLIKSVYHFQMLLITEPDNFKVHYRLSQLFDKLNQKKEATYHFERAVDLMRRRQN